MSRNRKRLLWGTAFETALLKLNPRLSGFIDWDWAITLYNLGLDPQKAAQRISKSKPIETAVQVLSKIKYPFK